MIRTVVTAASELARAGLAAIVRGDSRLALVGEATPRELERLVATHEPDVVLEQRDHGGEASRTPTVALVDDPGSAWDHERLDARRGPRALLSRDATAEEIVGAIVAVAAGLIALQPRALAAPAFAAHAGAAERLTGREVDVLSELARGNANKAIAARLGISEHTVKFHVASIFAKLGVASRTEAVARGARLGLIML